jgi:hypothetical protein
MANLIKPVLTKVITRDGEVAMNITLELNINLDLSGNLGSTINVQAVDNQQEEDEIEWTIPSFSSGEKIDDFGE